MPKENQDKIVYKNQFYMINKIGVGKFETELHDLIYSGIAPHLRHCLWFSLLNGI